MLLNAKIPKSTHVGRVRNLWCSLKRAVNLVIIIIIIDNVIGISFLLTNT